MKVSVLQENLLKAVQDVSRFVPAKPQIPILSCVFMKAQSGKLELTSTDLSVSIKTGCGGRIEVAGEFAVPAKAFLEYLSTLSPGALELEVLGGELLVKGKKLSSSFQGMLSKEFPAVVQVEGGWVEFQAKDFLEAVEKGGMAASPDESRPVFASLFWEIDPEFVQVVSTDGYRLSRKQIKNPGWSQQSFLVSAKTLREVARIIARLKTESVSLCVVNDGVLAVKAGGVEFTVRLVEGTFPAYRNILPQAYVSEMTFDREELVSALKSVMVFSREASGVVKVRIEGGEMVLAAASSALGSGEARVSLGDLIGGDNAIAFNGRYLLDVLGAVSEKTLRFSMNEGLKPGMFRLEKDESFLYLVMPFRT